MSIEAIGSAFSVAPTTGTSAAGSAAGADGVGGSAFAAELMNGLQSVQDKSTTANDLAIKAATGSLTDVHQYTIASTEASLATELTVALRNKAVEAFTEIMRMQV